MNAPRILPGDRAPDFTLPDAAGKGRNLYHEVCGKPIVLAFAGGGGEAVAKTVAGIPDSDLFLVAETPVEGLGGPAGALGDAGLALADVKGMISAAYRQGSGAPGTGPFAVVLDANQRVVATCAGDDLAGEISAALDSIPARPESRLVATPTPILVIPRVFDRAMCRRLIDFFENSEQSDGQIDDWDSTKGEVKRVDATSKRRRDHVIQDQALTRELIQTLGPRFAAEVHKAFSFEGFSFETFKLGRYGSEDLGFFKPHRDNIADNVKNRRFAVTVNLNAEEFEGGNLRFPEYSDDIYRPPTGAAVVFSCTLLHEVLPVTAGARYVLLTFLCRNK